MKSVTEESLTEELVLLLLTLDVCYIALKSLVVTSNVTLGYLLRDIFLGLTVPKFLQQNEFGFLQAQLFLQLFDDAFTLGWAALLRKPRRKKYHVSNHRRLIYML